MTREKYKLCVQEAGIRAPLDATVIPVFGETFRLVFAGIASGVCTEAMFRMSVPDIIAISEKVLDFFMNGSVNNLDFHILREPIEYKGEKIERLDFDFNNIGYRTYKECKEKAAMLEARNFEALAPYNNETFLLCFAAKAANMPMDFILKLSIRDCFTIERSVRHFLFYGDFAPPKAEEQETKTTPEKTDTSEI